MIKKLQIKNFKSLRDVIINTSNLNLLMGLNSMGKSSVLQSLLMLRQSYYKNPALMTLFINDGLISLGNRNDIFFQNAGEDEDIAISVYDENEFIEALYCYKSQSDDVLRAKKIDSSSMELSGIALFGEGFHYLGANHISPAKTYNSGSNFLNVLGNNGENAPLYLARHGNDKITNEALHHKNARSESLAHELDAWMGEISPGTRILAQEMADINLVRMGIQFETSVKTENGVSKEMSNEFAPINVGFGIPYAMPLVLSILISNPGDLVFIENPESHLHPRGQAELGRLISLASESGVQIFCETHSDHIINGCRVAVKNKIINSDNIKLFYFQKKEESNLETEIIPISVDSHGELEQYPNGLLDEWGNLMSQLF
jgi:predicted ATPase